MKVTFRDIKKVGSISIALLMLLIVRKAVLALIAVHAISLTIDPLISDQAQQLIATRLQADDGYKTMSAAKLDQAVRAQFPFITMVACSYLPHGILHLELEAAEPSIVLTDGRLVTEQNVVVPQAYYLPEAYEGCPELEIALGYDEHELSDEAFRFFMKMDPAIACTCSCTWHHQYDIACVIDNAVHLRCAKDTVPNKTLLERCNSIAQEMSQNKLYKAGWLADVRFADQIIISKLSG